MKSIIHPTTQDYTLLKDIRPMMRKLDIEVIVLQQESKTVITRDGKYIYWYLVADKSGVMVLKVWGPSGGMIKSGDILRISGIENKMVSDRHLLEVSRQGNIQRLGQDTFPFVETPNFSHQSELLHRHLLAPPSSSLSTTTAVAVAVTTSTTIASASNPLPYNDTIDQLQRFHQSSPCSRPALPMNYTTSSTPIPFDDNPSTTKATTTTAAATVVINFGPGWMGGLGRNQQHDMESGALSITNPNMEQQGNYYTNKRPMMDDDNNENTTMNRRKIDYNELM